MFKKTNSYVFLGLSIALSALLVIFKPQPEFNYDFETFFPQEDDELAFYSSFRAEFESDNDYLLIALDNKEGELLDPSFLQRAYGLQQNVMALDQVDTVISILTLEKPVIGVFGLGKEKVLDWEQESIAGGMEKLESYRSGLISEDGKSMLLWVKNEQGISKEDGDQLYTSIKQIFEESSLLPLAIAGKIQTQGDFVTLMQEEFTLFFMLSLLLILLLLVVIFKSWWGVLIPAIVLTVGVLWALGMIVHMGKAFDVMSVMQPTIFLIVGLSALVHYFSHLSGKAKEGVGNEVAIQEVFAQLLIPVWLTILTTSLGFMSLYFTSIPALQQFGLTTGLGVLVMFFAVNLITPGLLYLFAIPRSHSDAKASHPRFYATIFVWILHHKKAILIVFTLMSIGAVLLGTRVQVNGFLLDNLPNDHPIQQDFGFFDAQYGGSNPLEISVSPGANASTLLDYPVLVELDKLETRIMELFGGKLLLSPLSVVKTLNQAQNQGNESAYKLPSQGQYRRMQAWLKRALLLQEVPVISEDMRWGRISGRTADLGTLKMDVLRAELLEFVEKEVDGNLLQVRWTGTGYLIDKAHRSVTVQTAKGLLVAFVLVGAVAGLLFKSWRVSFVLLLTNLIPLVSMLGLMFLLGIEFKLTTAILFTVAFGIAVDDSIHFMTRLRQELSKGKDLLYALKRTFLETGKAIVLTSVILVAGFGLLAFSGFGVTHFTGLLISASLVFALLTDLVLLPVLLLPMKKTCGKSVQAGPTSQDLAR